jgi:hypothetical protein
VKNPAATVWRFTIILLWSVVAARLDPESKSKGKTQKAKVKSP